MVSGPVVEPFGGGIIGSNCSAQAAASLLDRTVWTDTNVVPQALHLWTLQVRSAFSTGCLQALGPFLGRSMSEEWHSGHFIAHGARCPRERRPGRWLSQARVLKASAQIELGLSVSSLSSYPPVVD